MALSFPHLSPPLRDPPGRRATPLPGAAGGNAVTLLSPARAAAELLLAVDGARDHINLETDAFPDDDLGLRLVERLVARARDGIRINLLHNLAASERCARLLQELSGHTVRLGRFRPRSSWTRWLSLEPPQRHRPRRLLGVDGRIGFMATGQADAAVGWNQTRLRLEGPVVQGLQREFVACWQRHSAVPLADARYFPPLAVRGTQGVALGPIGATAALEPCRPWRSALLGAVASARESVAIALACWPPPWRLGLALRRARSRGAQVRLLAPPGPAGARTDRALVEAGVEVQMRTDDLQGCTVCVIDGHWTSLGAGQGDWRSVLDHSETDLIVADGSFARSVLQALGLQLNAKPGAKLAAAEAGPVRGGAIRQADSQA